MLGKCLPFIMERTLQNNFYVTLLQKYYGCLEQRIKILLIDTGYTRCHDVILCIDKLGEINLSLMIGVIIDNL